MGSIIPSGPKQRRSSRRRISISFPFVAALLLVVFVQFSLFPQFFGESSSSSRKLHEYQYDLLKAGLRRCAEFQTSPVQYELPVSSTRTNPRWNPANGQAEPILLRNATLFDGESWLAGPVDILFSRGIVKSVSSFPPDTYDRTDVIAIDLAGKYVTPGLVDMHSHHLVGSWPTSVSADDSNEMNPATGPLTPFVRSLDGMKPYDLATKIIASGGITTSLIIPGSANIMGGEGFVVKNLEQAGEHGEWVVEDMLLEHGLPQASRRRYMKMACGENPSRVYDHTRMGNAWILRKHMSRAKELMQQQDEWCLAAAAAIESGDDAAVAAVLHTKVGDKHGLPEELELESSLAMLRGQMNINIHCYEPEDFEDMLRHSQEFGFHISAFHHALAAWKLPRMIKDLGENITIATFSEFAFYKQEAYEASLWAGKILAEHGIPVAYKSDHGEEDTNAKFLMFQAATAHAFHLPEDLAMQSVTSVPARSLAIDHRVGYVRPGYDADLVVWNLHPLRVGATPLQVYIDGIATLDPAEVTESMEKWNPEPEVGKPIMRAVPEPEIVETIRKSFDNQGGQNIIATEIKENIHESSDNQLGQNVIITGIKKSFLDLPIQDHAAENGNISMVLTDGKLTCFGPHETCVTSNTYGIIIKLENGHVLPGLTAVSSHLGLAEIDALEETADGKVSDKVDVLDSENVVYAKYGVHLDGKAFKRARIGGVTRAVTMPMGNSGLLRGVSVGIKTSGKKTILDGGIFQDDVALHFVVGQEDKDESTPTISSAIGKLRKILIDSKGKEGIYGQAANGSIPVVVHAESKYDIQQLIKIKLSHPHLNLVLSGGAGAPSVASALAEAHIPVILSPVRRAPAEWQTLDALVGPPLTKSPAQILADAGVAFAIAIGSWSDSHLHNLAVEASWAAMYAGLSEREAVALVSRNVEAILGLRVSEDERDIVVFEGNPLELGATVVVSIDGTDKSVMDFWPEAE